MKTPTKRQVEQAIKVLAFYGTIHNMRGDVVETDNYAQVIDLLKHDAERVLKS